MESTIFNHENWGSWQRKLFLRGWELVVWWRAIAQCITRFVYSFFLLLSFCLIFFIFFFFLFFLFFLVKLSLSQYMSACILQFSPLPHFGGRGVSSWLCCAQLPANQLFYIGKGMEAVELFCNQNRKISMDQRTQNSEEVCNFIFKHFR